MWSNITDRLLIRLCQMRSRRCDYRVTSRSKAIYYKREWNRSAWQSLITGQPGSSRVKEDRPFIVVPITRCTPIARALACSSLDSRVAFAGPAFGSAFAIRNLGMRARRKQRRGEKKDKSETHKFNEPCAEFIAAGWRPERSYSALNFLRNATATNLVLTRGIYATLMTKRS